MNNDSGFADTLISACQKNSLTTVKRLLKKGANPNIWGSDFQGTAAHAAAIEGNTKTLLHLFRVGADFSCKDCDALTPLEAAITYGRDHSVVALLNAGMDSNIHSDNYDLLTYVAYWGGEVFDKLLNRGANVSGWEGNHLGTTPLHRAMEGGNFEGAQALIKAGADIHAKNEEGNEPLGLATRANYPRFLAVMAEVWSEYSQDMTAAIAADDAGKVSELATRGPGYGLDDFENRDGLPTILAYALANGTPEMLTHILGLIGRRQLAFSHRSGDRTLFEIACNLASPPEPMTTPAHLLALVRFGVGVDEKSPDFAAMPEDLQMNILGFRRALTEQTGIEAAITARFSVASMAPAAARRL